MEKSLKKTVDLALGLLLVSMVGLLGCKDEASDTPDPVSGEWITMASDAMTFDFEGGNQERSFTLRENVRVSDVEYTLGFGGDEWCTVTIGDNKFDVRAEHSYLERDRSTTLTVAYGKEAKHTFMIKQTAAPSASDTKIRVVGGEATSEEIGTSESFSLSNSYDGNKLSYYNSKFGAVSYPFYLTYELESGHTLNSIVYTPRTDSGNKWGSFDEFSVSVSTESAPDEFVEIGSFARGNGVHTAFTISVPGDGIANAKKVRFTITKSYQDRVSCAEMEFFEASSHKFDPSSVFADDMCTKLRSDVTEKQLNQIPNTNLKALALALFNGSYDSKYRLADFRPYQNPSVMSARNKTSKYSQRDNVTGIYAKSSEKLAVIVGKLYSGANVSILIQDLNGGYGNSKSYILHEGYNEITADIGGLIYVMNHTTDEIPLLLDDADAATKKLVEEKTVKIHFANGNVNGYFDIAKNTESDWAGILDKAAYQDIDVLGKYSHVTWTVADFKKNNTEITRTVANCDSLVYWEQEFMGLVKYGKMFNNRMHLCVDYKAVSPNASDYRTVYNAGTYYAEPFCIPDRFAARCWGPAHEVGHCNQTRPGLKWSGMTEVTNNIMSLYVQTSFGQPCKLLVDNCSLKDENGESVFGYNNIYEAARLFIVDGHRAHCLPGVSDIVRETQLVPFWQLKLYMIDALGMKDFYHDLYEWFRTHASPSENGENAGLDQLDFVRQVCAVSGLNMLDFFEKWGFLTPVNTTLNDYGSKAFAITQAQIDALKAEIEAKVYPMPAADLHLITESNLNDYK